MLLAICVAVDSWAAAPPARALLPAQHSRARALINSSALESFTYSKEACSNLPYAAVPTPFDADALNAEAATPATPRWKFRLAGLVFALIKRSPLYAPIKKSAIEKMVASAESTGLDWAASVRALQDDGTCSQANVDAVVAENEPPVAIPAYFQQPFHAYDDGNLCWEHATEQSLASAAVGARNLPGLPPEEGEEIFRGAWERELRALLPDDCGAKTAGASIVDLGCGSGASARRLLGAFPSAASCVGLDLSPHMIVVGRSLLRRAAFSDARLRLVHGDAAATRRPSASADLVSLCLVLHELPAAATDEILAEANRVLKPGGHLARWTRQPGLRAHPLQPVDLHCRALDGAVSGRLLLGGGADAAGAHQVRRHEHRGQAPHRDKQAPGPRCAEAGVTPLAPQARSNAKQQLYCPTRDGSSTWRRGSCRHGSVLRWPRDRRTCVHD